MHFGQSSDSDVAHSRATLYLWRAKAGAQTTHVLSNEKLPWFSPMLSGKVPTTYLTYIMTRLPLLPSITSVASALSRISLQVLAFSSLLLRDPLTFRCHAFPVPPRWREEDKAEGEDEATVEKSSVLLRI